MILLLFLPLVLGWGDIGHHLIVNLAYNNLTDIAKTNIGYNLTQLLDMSTWADRVRMIEEYKWSYDYHFIDIKGDILEYCSFNVSRDCFNNDCVYSALQNYTNILTSNKTDLLAFKFLIHFYGDIFQPFHTAYALDRGGNDLHVRYNNHSCNLHHVWDSDIIESNIKEFGGYEQYLNYLETDITPNTTYRGGWDFANSGINYVCNNNLYYIGKNKIHKGDDLGGEYYNDNKKIVDIRLREGGYWLSIILNKLFK
jgi:hypothetical protein